MANLFNIEDILISPNFGIGKVVAIEMLEQFSDPFYVIESLENNVKTMIPTKGNQLFRRISTPDRLQEDLTVIDEYDPALSFDSKKDRITYFKKEVELSSLPDMLKAICELDSLSDRGSVEDKILNDLKNSVSIEISYVLKIDLDEGKTKLNGLLQASA